MEGDVARGEYWLRVPGLYQAPVGLGFHVDALTMSPEA